MTTNRKTSLYTIDIPGATGPMLSTVCTRLPVERQGSGFGARGAYVQFRASDDQEATRIALEAAGFLRFGLRTGLGAHLRFVSTEPQSLNAG